MTAPITDLGPLPPEFGRVVTTADPKPDYLIKDLLPDTSTFLISRQGVGKSTTVESAVRAMLDPDDHGRQWLGHEVVKRVQSVLWLCTDLGEAATRVHRFDNDSRIKFVDTLPIGDWPQFAKWGRGNFDLVVGDHTGGLSMLPQADDSTAAVVTEGLRAFDAPYIALHHVRKGKVGGGMDVALGSAQWMARARSALLLTRKDDDPRQPIQLRVVKANASAARPKITYRVDFGTGNAAVEAEEVEAVTASGRRRANETTRVSRLADLAEELGYDRTAEARTTVRALCDSAKQAVDDIWDVRDGRSVSFEAVALAVNRKSDAWRGPT